MFKDHLAAIINRTDLTESQMAEMMSAIFDGQTTDAQVGAMMAALATKGETVEELAGAARAMRKKAHRIQVAATPVVSSSITLLSLVSLCVVTVGTAPSRCRSSSTSTPWT